jgi:hypothetical protein
VRLSGDISGNRHSSSFSSISAFLIQQCRAYSAQEPIRYMRDRLWKLSWLRRSTSDEGKILCRNIGCLRNEAVVEQWPSSGAAATVLNLTVSETCLRPVASPRSRRHSSVYRERRRSTSDDLLPFSLQHRVLIALVVDFNSCSLDASRTQLPPYSNCSGFALSTLAHWTPLHVSSAFKSLVCLLRFSCYRLHETAETAAR